MACCRKSSGLTPTLHSRIEVLLKKISSVYPASYPVLVLNASNSEIIAHLPTPTVQASLSSSSSKSPRPVESTIPVLHHSVASMRRAASQFARSLESYKQAPSSSPPSSTTPSSSARSSFSNLRTLHIRGTENLFSLYVFDDSILAFYSQNMPRQEVQRLDFLSRDKKLHSAVISEMRQLLVNLRQSSTP